MGPRTRLVCVTHCSNVLGTIKPIREIADFVHARGAGFASTASPTRRTARIDVQALDVDCYVYSLLQDLSARTLAVL